MLMIQANQTKSLDGDIMCFINMYRYKNRYKIYMYQILYMLKMMKEYVSNVSNQIP